MDKNKLQEALQKLQEAKKILENEWKNTLPSQNGGVAKEDEAIILADVIDNVAAATGQLTDLVQ